MTVPNGDLLALLATQQEALDDLLAVVAALQVTVAAQGRELRGLRALVQPAQPPPAGAR